MLSLSNLTIIDYLKAAITFIMTGTKPKRYVGNVQLVPL